MVVRKHFWPTMRVVAMAVWSALLFMPGKLAAQSAEEDWDVTTPRGETRTIRFTTDEGTWTSVDVSPDGGTLVFDMVGEIWLLPIEGGEARPITKESGIALNFHPAFSPEGSRIAFISDREGQDNVWVMDADGSNPRQVSRQKEDRMALPAWTPDGQFVVARVGGDSNFNGQGSLWMWHVEGGEGVRLTPEDVNASWPELSPNGRRYLYYEERVSSDIGDPNPAKGLYQLRRMDLRTGRVLEITSGIGPVRDGGGGRRSSGGGIAPAVSPDGRFLAFGRRIADGTQVLKGHEYGPRTALWIRDLDTGAERIVMDPITPDIQERNNAGALPRHAWHPDGRSIVLTEGGKLRRLWVESGRVETIPFTATVEEVITEQVYHPFRISDGPFRVRMIRWHTASPDGRHLAFVALDRIWMMELPDGRPRHLTGAGILATGPRSDGAPDRAGGDVTPAQEYSPAWSPDGRWIAFTSWSDEEGGALWKVRASGGRPERLTSVPGMYLNPAWSSEGERIAVVRGSGEMLRGRLPSDEPWYLIESVPATGGEARLVAEVEGGSTRGHVTAPHFGPDGRIFYLEPEGKGRDTLYTLKSVEPDGHDVRSHLLLHHADEAAASPDGRWVAFSRGDNVHLVPLPWPGAGDPVEVAPEDPPVPVTRLSLEGGNFPNWTDGNTLEWGSANRYFRHQVDSRTTDTVEIRLEVPRRIARGTIALTGARIVTMDADRVIQRGDVLVTGGRIAAVGPSGSIQIPSGARRIDVSGMTIIPGLIDTHKHVSREGKGVLGKRSWELAANLAYGVTTGLEPSGWHENIFTMAETVEAGLRVGPRMFSTASSLSGGTSTRHGPVNRRQDAQHEVNRFVSYGATSIKQYWQRRRNQRQWVVEAAREAGVMVTSEGDTDHLSAISIAMDGHTGTEHPILNIPLYRDVTEFLGQANFFYSATLVVGGAGPWGEDYFYQEKDLWKDEKLQRFTPWRWLEPHTRRRPLRPVTDYPFPLHAQGAADIIAAGGHATIGAHGQTQGLDSHFELWMYASAMEPMEALKTATVHPAQMIGILDDVATLEEGKLADLLVLNRNPLEDIRASADIRYVMKGGVLYDGDTLDELWPEERSFGDFYWRIEGVREGFRR